MPDKLKTKISRFVFLGDSLSDRGTLNKRKLLGFIPMSVVGGLSGFSPRGRFTNGFLWGDFIAAALSEEFILAHRRRKQKLKKSGSTDADLADEILTNDHQLRSRVRDAFSLDDDKQVTFEGERFARFYCEGGLTAKDYSRSFTIDPIKMATREVVDNLADKTNHLLQDDRNNAITESEKRETLVIEWSGANDLITVNSEPSQAAAQDAVHERINNVKRLIASGYKNIVLINLPDLSLTPRFQRRGEGQQKNAKECTDFFNAQLAKQHQLLKGQFPDVSIHLFDVERVFSEVYNNAPKYGFDPSKLASPYMESDAFKRNHNDSDLQRKHISPAPGYMFWDDVHPSADMHALLAEKFQEQFQEKFDFQQPSKKSNYPEHILKFHHASKQLDYLDLAKTPMLKAINELLATIEVDAQIKMKSFFKERNKKGELLLDLVETLRSKSDDLHSLKWTLNHFMNNQNQRAMIQTHYYAFFDSIIGKKTTHSEDLINTLMNTIDNLIEKQEQHCQVIQPSS